MGPVFLAQQSCSDSIVQVHFKELKADVNNTLGRGCLWSSLQLFFYKVR